MTEKRFMVDDAGTLIDMETRNMYELAYEVVDLLNEQHEENIELKHDNKRLVKFIMSKGYTLKDYLDWLQKEVWE